jgi:4-amino-4-deoxy-L-arabinose transferase-like glycosyltransferase
MLNKVPKRYASGAALIMSTISVVVVLMWGGAYRPGIVQGALPNWIYVVLVVLACGGYLAMLAAQHRWGGLNARLVAATLGAQYAAAVAVPPRSSRDLWWYAIYGRVAGVHHANPYVTVPAKFPADPFFHVVGTYWAHTRSVYGPLFMGISTIASQILGTSLVATRLFYQLLALAAIVLCCVIVWRRTRSVAAVAFLGANPLTALVLVNGGKNDALVGVALLGAVVLSMSGKDRAAGVVGALGALVKITGFVGLAVVIATVWHSRGRRAALRCTAMAGSVMAIGYALVGSAALLTPMKTAGARFTRGSVWHILTTFDITKPSSDLALAVMALLVVVVFVRARKRRVDRAVTETMTAMTMAAPYTLASYVGWALPTAALDHRSRVSRIAMSFSVLLIAGYGIFDHRADADLTRLATNAVPIVLLVLLVLLLRGGRSRPSRPRDKVLVAAHRQEDGEDRPRSTVNEVEPEPVGLGQ